MNKEKLKEEIKQVVTNLGNIEFTVEDELEFCKQCLNKAKKIIETAVNDFNLEYGTPQYDRLLNGTKSLGIEVKDYE